MFVLMIDGTPIAVTDADQAEAEALFASADFREDLKSFTTDGKPVWNGTSEFVVRPATEEENEAFEEAMFDDGDAFEYDDFEDEDEDEDDADDEEDEDEDDEEDDDDGHQVMFLIAIDQLSDEV